MIVTDWTLTKGKDVITYKVVHGLVEPGDYIAKRCLQECTYSETLENGCRDAHLTRNE